MIYLLFIAPLILLAFDFTSDPVDEDSEAEDMFLEPDLQEEDVLDAPEEDGLPPDEDIAGDEVFEPDDGADIDDEVVEGVPPEEEEPVIEDVLFIGSDDKRAEEVFTAGPGNDTIIGGAGELYAVGGLGDDYFEAGTGYSNFNGQSGDDLLIGGPTKTTMAGGPGNDTIIGGSGFNTISIVELYDHDRLDPTGGPDSNYNVISDVNFDFETGEADVAYGGERPDSFLFGSADTITGGGSADHFITGPWLDTDNPATITDIKPGDALNELIVGDSLIIEYEIWTEPPVVEIVEDEAGRVVLQIDGETGVILENITLEEAKRLNVRLDDVYFVDPYYY